MNSLKPLHVALVVLFLFFAVYGMAGIKGAITPYVDIASARQTSDRVQVKGSLDKASLHVDTLGQLIFTLTDFKSHEKFTVVYSGQHPANMQMARDVVAMGRWNPGSMHFEADQMNIKCPDKYQTGSATSK